MKPAPRDCRDLGIEVQDLDADAISRCHSTWDSEKAEIPSPPPLTTRSAHLVTPLCDITRLSLTRISTRKGSLLECIAVALTKSNASPIRDRDLTAI